MTFSQAHYEAVITRLDDGINKLPAVANRAIQATENEYGWIPGIGSLVMEAVRKFVSLMDELLRKLEEYMQSALVPVAMWLNGGTWLKLQQQLGTMAGQITGQIQANGSEWTGIASGAYVAGVQNQAPAVQQISNWAGTVSGACNAVAEYGLGFYVGCLAAVVSLLVGIVTGLGIPGAVVIAIAAVGAALASFYLGVEPQGDVLDGLLSGNSAFPGGSWPVAKSS